MKTSLRFALSSAFTLVTVAACDGGTGPDDKNRVVSVTVTSTLPTIVVGGTAQASASAIKRDGTALQNPTITWESSAPNVATVSTSGLITGVSPGNADIRAKVQNVTGQVTITVTSDPCAAPISVNVGEVRTFAGPDQVRCVRLAPATTPSEYLVIAYNGAPIQDERRTVQIAGNLAAAQVAPQVSTLREALEQLALQRLVESDAIHERIDAVSRKLVDPLMRARRGPAALLSRELGAQAAALPPNVGDTLSYRVPNLNPGKAPCLDFFPISAVVKAVGSRVALVEDVASPAGGFTTQDYVDIAREFDTRILATDTAWFGGPTDRNNDGVIVVLYTPEVNKLTPQGATGFTAGFFFRADMFTKAEFQAAGQRCDTTNEQELFYLLTPDPTGSINGNVRSTATVRQTTRGTIAHELEHMLNQGVRMFLPTQPQLETVWLDEAMAHFAEEAVGRATRGFSDFRELSFADVTADVNDYNAYFRQNLGRFRLWMFRPDTSSATSNRAATELGPRGAGWAFLRYAIDRHSNNNGKAFTRDLVRGPQTNIDNLMARIGSGVTFDQFLRNWMVTNFADHQSLTGLAATFNYVGWNMRSVMTQFNNNNFPLLVTPLSGAFQTLVISGSGAYFRLTRPAGGPAATVAMQAPGGLPVDFAGARLTIVRTL
ncbi:MAG: Ig-like domain-containing protein [Gemmatimonadaceae bacterium]